MANQFTHHAATAALVAAGFWIMSAVSGLWGKGSLLTDWTDLDYAIWTALTAVAVLATIVVVVGVLLREDGRHGALKIAGIGLAVIGGALLIVGTWAWAATSPVLAAAGLVVALRLRATGLGAPTDWLLAAAWPIGISTLTLLEELKVGPTDSSGEGRRCGLGGHGSAP
jgi:hypothetical protein